MYPHLQTWPAPLGLFFADAVAATVTTPASTSSTADTTSTKSTTSSASSTSTTVTPPPTTAPTSFASVQRTTITAPLMTMPADRTAWANTLLHHQKTGVPAMHQTIIDRDYDMASILLAAGADIGTFILPPLSERHAADKDKYPVLSVVKAAGRKRGDMGAANDDDYACPSFARFVSPPELRTEQIIDFLLYLKSMAPQENLHFIGANAVTLSLLAEAPMDFLRKLCTAAIRQHPSLLNAPDKFGRTPLTIAAAQGNAAVVNLLLEFKADPEGLDGPGYPPMEYALRNGHTEVIRALYRHGAADPAHALGELRDMKSEDVHDDAFNLLDTLFAQQDMDTLLDYQSLSARHCAAVFEVLLMLCAEEADSGEIGALGALLDFARPLLTTDRLAEIAIAIARRPGKHPELLSILKRMGDDGFPVQRLAALRDAAGTSRDPVMLELAVSLDPALTRLVSSKATPDPAQQAQLNRLLALALQARADELAAQLHKRGAVLNLNDPALDGLPMVAILADHGDAALLARLVHAQAQGSGPAVNLQVTAAIDAIDAIKTGKALLTLRQTFPNDFSSYQLHQMLCHAVRLGDMEAVEALVKGGVSVNYAERHPLDFNDMRGEEATPVSIATAAGNLPMVKLLISLGGTTRQSDANAGYRAHADLARAFDMMS